MRLIRTSYEVQPYHDTHIVRPFENQPFKNPTKWWPSCFLTLCGSYRPTLKVGPFEIGSPKCLFFNDFNVFGFTPYYFLMVDLISFFGRLFVTKVIVCTSIIINSCKNLNWHKFIWKRPTVGKGGMYVCMYYI